MKPYKCIRHESDVLVIGGGGAAVRAALSARNTGSTVILVDKGSFGRSGTSPLSLHGFACTLHPEDSEKRLFADIRRAGCEISDLDLVEVAARESRTELDHLEEMGVRFVRNPDGSYYIYSGAGHSFPHNVLFDEAANGLNFVALLGIQAWKSGVSLIDGVMVVNLLVEDRRCVGAIGIDQACNIHLFSSRATILAAGGANRLYPNVVPRISHPMYRTTGDGYALALQAGLTLVDMEFANFRDSPPAAPLGGVYVNAKGERFMEKYEPVLKEAAPRGKVVEALYREMQAGNGPIYIELGEKADRAFEILTEEYKAYVRAYREGKRPPVTITFQRLLGGARIRKDTSTEIEGLYIAGENAGGFHGADRLQGASFLETQVFGRIAGLEASKFATSVSRRLASEDTVQQAIQRSQRLVERSSGPSASDYIRKIQDLAWNHAGIVRSGQGLTYAIGETEKIRKQLNNAAGNCFEIFEAMNLAITAEAVFKAALLREETRGTHRRSDYPEMDDRFSAKHTAVSMDPSGNLRSSLVASRSPSVFRNG